MAYNEEIDRRIRDIVTQWPGIEAKKMFGGVCHLLHGNIVCGVLNDELILRLGPEGADNALSAAHVRPFDTTGRPMRGWVMVATEGFTAPGTLEAWLDLASRFVLTLPDK